MAESSLPGASSSPTTRRWRGTLSILAVLVVVLLLCAAGYRYLLAGALRARQAPSEVEAFLAHGLVELSIPSEMRARKNPLTSGPESADTEAGRERYQKNCEACHGPDGRGLTGASSGLYPHPPELSRAGLQQRKRTDGELFYLIRYGVRNTAMPGWQLPDRETWQLVSYLRNLPLTVGAAPASTVVAPLRGPATAQYVGSATCAECHQKIYTRWRKTPMANVVRDPREHPEAILPDLSRPDPLLTFTKEEIALVYGSIWKQRYFKRVGDDYYPMSAQWDITHQKWKPYAAKEDWWVPFYPGDNSQRPTSALCDGCHSVNYDIRAKTVTEWNVGCEKCHGPGSEHLRQSVPATILNPARMDFVAANDSCIQCHSQGRPRQDPIEGKHYDWPVGYELTKKLSDYWQLEAHQLGATTFTHFADGTAHKNRMQGNDYVSSQMYTHGVTCFTCHDAHGTDYPSNLRQPAATLCLDCHGPTSPNGPHAATLAQHTHHASGSAGSDCVACHMPKIAQTIGDVYVRSHTFRFVGPAQSESLKIPNACNVCHSDKSDAWTAEALKTWPETSPWRVGR